jgi:hypothetical protein
MEQVARFMFSNGSPVGFSQFIIDRANFDKDLAAWLATIGLRINFGEIFRTGPMTTTRIHVDGGVMDAACKLNWAFGANGSRMAWWKPNHQATNASPKITPKGTRYLDFDESECTMLHSAEIGQPSLVNVGVPHNIINATNQTRWCVSYTLGMMEKDVNLQWPDAVSRLGPHLTG